MTDDIALIRALRLRAQGLAPGSQWQDAPAVARGMLAMQAQDGAGVRWALSLRAADQPVDASVLADIEAGRIVCNRPSRGTLQVTAPEDMAWLTETMSARSRAAAANRREQLQLTDAMLERATDLIRAHLATESDASRAELIAACESGGLSLNNSQAGHVLRHLTETMTIVFVTSSGRAERYAAAERWLPATEPVDREQALAEIARRFVAARGPVTRTDLAKWSCLAMADVDAGLAAANLDVIELAGQQFFVDPMASEPTSTELDQATKTALLLPPFDEYVIGYQDRAAILDDQFFERIVPGRNGMFKPIVVIGGEILGTWSRKLTTKLVRIEVKPFNRLPKRALKGLEKPTEEYARFLGRSAEVSLG